MTTAESTRTAQAAETGGIKTWLRGRYSLFDVLATALTMLLALFFIFPLYWAAASALKRPAELHLVPPLWIPPEPQWQNFVDVGRVIPFFRFIGNTAIITILGSIGGVVSASLVGYGFSSFRFRGRNILFIVLLSTMMLPDEVTLIPTYMLFNYLGWVDTFKPLIVPNFLGGGAFSIFLFRQFFASMPKDLNDAAKIDGCGPIRYYWNILMPLSVPVIITICILYFQFLWNDLMRPLIYLISSELFPISVGLLFLQSSLGTTARRGQPTEHLLMAGSVLAMLPSIIIFFTLQRYFIKGVVMTGIKG